MVWLYIGLVLDKCVEVVGEVGGSPRVKEPHVLIFFLFAHFIFTFGGVVVTTIAHGVWDGRCTAIIITNVDIGCGRTADVVCYLVEVVDSLSSGGNPNAAGEQYGSLYLRKG